MATPFEYLLNDSYAVNAGNRRKLCHRILCGCRGNIKHGVSVVPLGFLVIQNGEVRMLDLKNPASFEYGAQDPVSKTISAVNSLIDKGPDLVLKIRDLIASATPAKTEEEAVAEQTEE